MGREEGEIVGERRCSWTEDSERGEGFFGDGADETALSFRGHEGLEG